MTQLINEREAAALLRLSIKCLQNWRVRGGSLPFVKVGRAVRYRLEDLEAFVQEAVRRSTSDPGPALPGRPGIRVDHMLEKTGRALTPGPSTEPAPRPSPTTISRPPTPGRHDVPRRRIRVRLTRTNQHVTESKPRPAR